MKPKLFSLDEANATLPYVKRVVSDIQATYQKIVEVKTEFNSVNSDTGDPPKDEVRNELNRMQTEISQLADEFHELIDELQRIGCELKDPSTGLLDFYALHEDRMVYLCWKQGEDQIEHWHELDAGFAGRQPVELLETSS